MEDSSLHKEAEGEQISKLLDRIAYLRKRSGDEQRILIAVAGGPGSGKSTLCARLLQEAQKKGLHDMVAVPMDGFHFPKSHLAALQDPAEAFARRGNPLSFNAAKFVEAVASLKATASGLAPTDIALPGFDHAVQDPVDNEIIVLASAKVVLLEGNYVLLNEKPWNQISDMVDDRWYIDVPRDVAKLRLIERHLRAGIETCSVAAAARAESNDLMNADYIASRLIEPDMVIRSV
ncbi:unnamed protein product [Zymoseptoria tritici ST99CH_1A5]|uniref:Phosphoribulokinase/uridine kinase domain-containing protein n=3 Tax=Zymoseptoria tritici TaxID=1047171 RepID=A0A1X7RLG6_ZYMT9|nr:unnamed protein product [Zymoseptoria tritici ST99CH_3D7]SMR46583.1 unnamed protein product [Zymoseptoria tritici ST99CH_1E4]SMR47825.1 unnamed protein product [Zymoseptoria tritici ST99CH_3D1]SMY21732.1 unnamed protein product [Zymoseptoria tritici ST99CH_1A5]